MKRLPRIALAASIVACAAALAAPYDGLPTSEKPIGTVLSQTPFKAGTYGLCDGPQNADAFPSSPVAVKANPCDNTQTFTATSVNASTGSTCGGFTVAFGPMGDLKPALDRVQLIADWGDTPLTQAQCAKAKVAAVGWGAHCTDDACTQATWEKIGDFKQRTGTWNPNSNVCYFALSFYSTDKKFKTLNLDIITRLEEGGQIVRKRAKGTIIASHPNGKCLSTTTQRKAK